MEKKELEEMKKVVEEVIKNNPQILESETKKYIDKLRMEKLRLMVFESAKEFGNKVNEHLVKLYGMNPNEYSFILPIKESWFSDGNLKVEVLNTARGKCIYTLTDVGNYSISYTMHQMTNHASPNDLFIQLKNGIGACNGHAKEINVIMPLLYNSRQHRRNTREPLACGEALHELEDNKKLQRIITFDAHDQGVEHSLHHTEFDNFLPSNVILDDLLNDVDIDDLLVITTVAPDNGANGRRNIYLNSLNAWCVSMEAGSFYKQRDYNKVVNGKNPIISHDYCGNNDLKGKTAIVTDDMIASGSSMFDVMKELKKRGINKIYIIATFALFTEGIDKFREYYKNGMFDGIYTTNLSYIPEEYMKEEWLKVCDCSKMVANIIYNTHNDLSIEKLLRDKSEPQRLLQKKYDLKYGDKR